MQPGWQRDHTYNYAAGPSTRVVNGPGWNETKRSYNPGEPLKAYQLTSPGTCTSATSGGPSGVGTAIADGTCTWKYLSAVDYISITGWANDNKPWTAGRHLYFDIVTSDSPLRAYGLSDDSCSSTVAPTGKGVRQSNGPYNSSFMVTTSDGCHWIYQGDILYTSRVSYIPTIACTSVNAGCVIQMAANYKALLWNDREYVAGQNGENPGIGMDRHQHNPGVMGGSSEGAGLIGCDAPSQGLVIVGNPRCFRFMITTAPGESFADSLTSSSPLSGYDPSKGVAIYNPNTYQWPYEPTALGLGDPFVDIIGLQLKSAHGASVVGLAQDSIDRSILEGGSRDDWTFHAAAWFDAGPCLIANSLIISARRGGRRFQIPGCFIARHHHSGRSPRGQCRRAETGNQWVYENTIVADTAIFGFAHAGAAANTVTSFSARSANNVTDAPVGDAGRTIPIANGPAVYLINTIPGTIYGASAAAAVVAPRSDWRAKHDGPLAGKAVPFGDLDAFCQLPQGPRCANYAVFNFDSPDIIGTPRPQDGRYDIGAWQSCSAATGNGDTRRPGFALPGKSGEEVKC